MYTGAGGALGYGLTLRVYNGGAGAGLGVADRHQVSVIGQGNGEAVVRFGQGDGGGIQGGRGALVPG